MGVFYNLLMAKVKKPERQRNKHFIKEWREFLGLKQEEAAEKIGVTQSTLSRVEGAKTPYDQDFLEMASQAYGVSIEDLVSRHPATGIAPIRGEAQILGALKRIEGLNDHDIQLHFELIMRDIRFNASAREQSRSDDQPPQSTPHHALKP